jgi:hypothetical protein
MGSSGIDEAWCQHEAFSAETFPVMAVFELELELEPRRGWHGRWLGACALRGHDATYMSEAWCARYATG